MKTLSDFTTKEQAKAWEIKKCDNCGNYYHKNQFNPFMVNHDQGIVERIYICTFCQQDWE